MKFMLWIAVLMAGCTSKTVTPPMADLAAGAPAVEQVFAAFNRSDCAALTALLGGELKRKFDKRGCALETEPLREARLIRVAPAVRDGRDSQALIVEVEFTAGADTLSTRARVVRDGDAYRVVAL